MGRPFGGCPLWVAPFGRSLSSCMQYMHQLQVVSPHFCHNSNTQPQVVSRFARHHHLASLRSARWVSYSIEVPSGFWNLNFSYHSIKGCKKGVPDLTLYCLILTVLAFKFIMGSKINLKKFCKKIYGNRLRKN